MKKKYFILALTFLCLFLGQSSYAQEGWEDEDDWYVNESWDSNDNDYTDNWQDFLSEWFGLDIAGITEGGNFLLSNGDYFYPDSGNLDEVLVNSYHVSEQYEYVPIGENNGNPGGDESEETVDDPTDNCSISYCMPGYTLQNCECVKIPPPCDKLAKANLAELSYDTENGLQKDPSKLPSNVTIVPPSELPSGIDFTNSNGFNSALYRVDNGNGNIEYVYATAGTSITEIQDIINDAQQAGGFSSPQYQLSVDNAMLLKNWAASNNYSLSFTGHSLGGGLANANALATGLPATIYNPAGLNDLTISNDPRLHLYNSGNVTAYVVQGEPIYFINTLLQTPIRGNVIPIGSIAYPAIMYGISSAAAVTSAGTGSALFGIAAISLHSMSNVISDIDCN
ncbi:hypothetical protein [Flavobacterium cellulosilyticum]|uniref:Fungal lipase-like domain-containing protein n=1 Tax=Flavobacterium cellulosilyticum TaxID=2541731 RepID=A0A4R5CJP0_9FLAO|nr:hypothetical protein [Flavobacterium cellulosilyticum]TDD98563.1 hypothetical protein E0F76_05390 [Flavobacterium cellulosilyticum]